VNGTGTRDAHPDGVGASGRHHHEAIKIAATPTSAAAMAQTNRFVHMRATVVRGALRAHAIFNQ